MRIGRASAMTATALVVSAVATAGAGATAPGTNGRIVFTADAGPHGQLYTVEPDGTGLRQVTRFRADSGNADWSPDGNSITFQRTGETGAIWVMAADGAHPRVVVAGRVTSHESLSNVGPAYSPDGRWLVFGREVHYTARPARDFDEIDIVRTDGSGLRRVTPKLLNGPNGKNQYGEHSQFSPGGTMIAFVRETAAGAAVFVIDVDGTRMRQLTPYALGVDDRVDWSPDGSLLLFSSAADDARGRPSNVYTVRPDGTGLKRLTNEPRGVSAKADSWSPDGKEIAFVRATNTAQNLYVMNADASAPRQITHGLFVHGGAWGTHA